uniref:TELO2 interacting protein 2 n=1 Tax=Lepisosteus oculatus TaxID=7918 RepID=W5NDB4_LEPOC
MDLPDILQSLRICGGTEGGSPISWDCPSLSVVKVLSQIKDLFQAEASPRTKEDILKSIQHLLATGDSHWLFSDCCNNEGTSVRRVYLDLTSALTQYAALPPCETDSGELPTSSYALIPQKAVKVSAVLLSLIKRLEDSKDLVSCSRAATPVKSLALRLMPSLFVFAVIHSQDEPWTSTQSKQAAGELLSATIQAAGCTSAAELLCGKSRDDDSGILGSVLEMLKPELKKDIWMRNQATKHIFSWTLTQVSRPWLSEFLDHVFPPSLLFSDDYRTENEVLGVHCLRHIILNVPAADLRQYNRAEVLYHALFKHLYKSDPQLIEAVLPCLLDLLSVLEKPPSNIDAPRKSNRYDEVLRLFLTHMEMEHKISLRRVYARNLPLFTSRLGIVTVRHLKRLERVIVGYLEVYDGPEEEARLCVLEALERTIQHAWPRMKSRINVLLKTLLRLLYDVATDLSPTPPAVREELMKRATRCLILLDHSCQGTLKVLLKEVDSSCTHIRVLECIEQVQQQDTPLWGNSPPVAQGLYQKHGLGNYRYHHTETQKQKPSHTPKTAS